MVRFYRNTVLTLALLLVSTAPLLAQVPQPSDFFGFSPGDDYQLADYDEVTNYLQQLDASSDRVRMIQIGESVQGKPLFLMFISSEANLNRLEHWRMISENLARARIDENTAQSYAREGKAIVWIDGGMHATERAGAQMTPQLAYRLATEESPEMQRIRDDVVILLMPNLNPDGLDIVANWYRQFRDTPFETTGPAWLYHHYVGHDNNRDWFMNNMPESEAASRVLYNEWYPQIVHNHHQTSPAWARIFLPPFADPVNPNIHPGVTTAVNLVGTAMANRFAMKKMPGVVSDFQYSMWWNGGMRTAPYFHNMVGILTETAHATPTPRFYDPDSLPRMLGSRRSNTPTDGTDIFYPYPWEGGDSHFKDAVDYMITASMAILSLASDRREKWLMNIYSMGRDAIENADETLPFAYVISPNQWDPGEAHSLISVLRKTGIEVHKARRPFSANGIDYPRDSYIIYGAQAFRPMLTDLMEPQYYPDRRAADGTPQVPYDLAGWTLPIQMGIQVDRVMETFNAQADVVENTGVAVGPSNVARNAGYGYLLSHNDNNAVKAANKLLAQGESVFWTVDSLSVDDTMYPPGSILIQTNESTQERVETVARELGLTFGGLARDPGVSLRQLAQPRIGLYKSWVANMDEGWTRWLLEQYEFQVDTLHDADMRQDSILQQYHALIIPSQSKGGLLNGHAPNTMPEPYTGGIGLEGTYAMKQYVEEGGTLIALDASSDYVIDQFGLPVRNVVASVPAQRFFIPGSLIRTDIETRHPLALGVQEQVGVSFQRSRAFEIIQRDRKGEGGAEDTPLAPLPPVHVVARYAQDDLLMSGWALGEEDYIAGKAAMMNVSLGEGNVVLFGFRPQFRGQPSGTYKLLFNALHAATLDEALWNDPDSASLPSPDNRRP